MTATLGSCLLVLLWSSTLGSAFTPEPPSRRVVTSAANSWRLKATTSLPELALSVREIKDELKQRRVSFSDCFDKESLALRLKEAREGSAAVAEKTADGAAQATDTDVKAATVDSPTAKGTDQSSDESLIEEIRQMRVKELRGELARRNLRWAGLLEKEDLVQAVYRACQKAAAFSVTGKISPGEVGDLTGEELAAELSSSSSSAQDYGPLLLDAYAVWCGPCQMMAPQLAEAAKVLGDRNIRVAKMATDKHAEQASRLRVQGLPTLILFDAEGTELDRIEGALMKDQLLEWVDSKLSS